MAGARGLLCVVAALAASASGMPCPVWCPQHQQGAAPSPWQVLLLPPHNIVVLVPGNIRLCSPQQSAAQATVMAAPNLQTEAATTGRPVPDELGPTVTQHPAGLAQLEMLLRSFINDPVWPCGGGGGQLKDAAGMCRDASRGHP